MFKLTKQNKSILFLVMFAASISCSAQLGAGLVSQYYFNGNANDMVGINHGIVRGATLAPDRFGVANSAYCFNGQNNLINLGTSSSLKSGTMSISFWAKMTNGPVNSFNYANHPFIFTKANNLSGGYESYFVGVFKPTDEVDAATSSLNALQTVSFSGITATQNVWKHIVFMFTLDSTYLYVNNVLSNQLYKGYASSYWLGDSVVLGFVGNIPNGLTFSWLNGCLDDFRMYNRKLSHAEITQLYLESRPAANFTFNSAACRGASVTFTDNSSNAPTSWAWSVSPITGVTINTPISQNPVITFASSGTFTITLVATNAMGSGIPVNKIISVSPCTGVEQRIANDEQITLYPNPSAGKIKLSETLPENSRIIIYNHLGEKIKDFKWALIHLNQNEIDLSELNNGVYFIECKGPNFSMTKKLIIDK